MADGSSALVLDRKDKLLSGFDPSAHRALEFGPLNAPILHKSECDVRYIDVKPTEELRGFIDTASYRPEEFVEIDYVWPRQKPRDYDFAIASHVIEHTPNLIGWINDAIDMLKPGGILALAIPDKRYTFDILREETTLREIIDDFFAGRTLPSPRQVFDHYSNAVDLTKEAFYAAWDGSLDVSTLRHFHDMACAISLADLARKETDYIDCHAYVFTPQSFRRLINEARRIGLLKAEITAFFDTAIGSHEFIVHLARAS